VWWFPIWLKWRSYWWRICHSVTILPVLLVILFCLLNKACDKIHRCHCSFWKMSFIKTLDGLTHCSSKVPCPHISRKQLICAKHTDINHNRANQLLIRNKKILQTFSICSLQISTLSLLASTPAHALTRSTMSSLCSSGSYPFGASLALLETAATVFFLKRCKNTKHHE